MPESVLLLLAFALNVSGMGLLALAMKTHWDQVRAPRPYPAARARTLRLLGSAALASSLALCIGAGHVSTAALVWVMALTASAFVVALTLAYRPRCLGWLVVWIR